MTWALRVLPWHEGPMEDLGNRFDTERLSHALLIAGRRYTGKSTFARALAARVLCDSPGLGACGRCSECLLIEARTHPDLMDIEPVESKQIRVEQIRSLLLWMRGTPQRGGYRVVVLRPAHAMNATSANALLKGLEEPGRDSLLLLVTDQPGRLLPTVRSRCQRVELPLPDVSEGLAWLRDQRGVQAQGEEDELLLHISNGSPVEALVRGQDGFINRRAEVYQMLRNIAHGASPLDVAAQLARMDGLEVVELWSGLLLDIVRAATGADGHCRNRDQRDLVRSLAGAAEPTDLAAFADELNEASQALSGPSNPNPQLLFEHLIYAWSNL